MFKSKYFAPLSNAFQTKEKIERAPFAPGNHFHTNHRALEDLMFPPKEA